MSAPVKRRPPAAVTAETPPTPPTVSVSPEPPPPYLLDFLPREAESETRLARFFLRLREGKLSTTRCPRDGTVSWPPRTVCPQCHQGELDWLDLPGSGRLYAFSAVLGGAPLGMEGEVPFAVGLVDLDGAPLRLFGRIVGRGWSDLAIGEAVQVETYAAPDGRYFYRFRAAPVG